MTPSQKPPWPEVRLGDILTERTETPNPGEIETGMIPIIAKISFSEGTIELRDGTRTRTKMILIRPGDLVVSGINAAKGGIAIYDEEEDSPIAATIHYAAYIPDKSRVDVRYLWWLLRSETFRDVLKRNLPGGVKTELKAKRLLPIQVPLPPLDEQHRIVARIEELAALIVETQRLRNESSIVTAGLMESSIEEVMSRLPDVSGFGEVVTLKPRSGPSFLTDPDWGGMPVLMPSAVTGFGVDITKVEFGPGDKRISEKDLLIPGDILIARGNKPRQVGNAGVVPKEARGWVCANLLMRTQVDTTRVDPYFCIYWLRSPRMRAHVRQNMKGTNPSIQKINQRIILDFPFPKVSISEQRQVVIYLDDLQAQVNELTALQEATQAELDALLPSVLDRAFRGEL